MICEIICVAGFLCMSHLDIVHISSVYVHIICILSEHMRIMHILSALVLHMFFPNRQCQCDLYVISTTLYRSYDVQLSFHTMFTQTHIVNAIYMLYAHIHIIAGSLEAAYSLNWGAQEIWGKGGGETLALL